MLARNGADDATTNPKSTEATTSAATDDSPSAEAEVEQERAQDHQKLVAAAEDKKEAVKTQICDQRKSRIVDRETHIADQAASHLASLNARLTRIESFISTKNLTVANLDSLKNTAEAKQSATKTALDKLKAVAQAPLDCTSTNRKAQLSDFQTAFTNFKNAAKDYRQSIVAIYQAAATALGASQGGNQ